MNQLKELPKNPCAICRKREVTKLCDFVTGYSWTTMKHKKGRMIGQQYDTCDLPMCEKCANKQGSYDFCPYHTEMLKTINNPDKTLRKRRFQFEAKQLRESGL